MWIVDAAFCTDYDPAKINLIYQYATFLCYSSFNVNLLCTIILIMNLISLLMYKTIGHAVAFWAKDCAVSKSDCAAWCICIIFSILLFPSLAFSLFPATEEALIDLLQSPRPSQRNCGKNTNQFYCFRFILPRTSTSEHIHTSFIYAVCEWAGKMTHSFYSLPSVSHWEMSQNTGEIWVNNKPSCSTKKQTRLAFSFWLHKHNHIVTKTGVFSFNLCIGSH